jgi:hypothetical protein
MSEKFLADGKQAPEEWMRSWTHQVCELITHFSHEVATLTERVASVEERVKTCVSETHLERKAAETRDHFISLGLEMEQMENQISTAFQEAVSRRETQSKKILDALFLELEKRTDDISNLQAKCASDASKIAQMLHQSFQAALSLSGSKAVPGTSIAGSQHNAEVPSMKNDACHVSDAIGAKWELLAAESSELQGLLEKEVLPSQMSTTPGASNVGSQLNSTVKLTPLTTSDAWRCFDVVGAKWKLLAAELSELHALLKKGELQVQISTGDPSALDLSALKSHESMPLLSEPIPVGVDQQLTESTGVSNADEESDSFNCTSPDDQSTILDDRSMTSESIYSTRSTISEPLKGTCKDFVRMFESRLKRM